MNKNYIPKVALINHGCAKNLVDSELMLGLLAQNGIKITLDDAGEFASQAVSTIICEGDAIGAVILCSRGEKGKLTETEAKLAAAAAGFLGRQMEQ